MAYVVVPHEVSASTATIWMGAIDERVDPGQVRLVSQLGEHAVGTPWEHWASRTGTHRLDYRRLTLTGLPAQTPMTVQLLVNGQPQADASLTTLPPHLPTLAEKPFTVLLGSCFCLREDAEGAVGQAYVQLPAGSRPDVKILCGDQVYLDDPWAHYLWNTHDVPELEEEFFRNYRETWTQAPGFRQLLTHGANYFSPDDHDYWNNAPNAATVIRDTWSEDGRRQWFATARQFYQMFQNPASSTTFTVPPLSFLIIDTRSNRTSNQTDFMLPADLQGVEQWVQHLTGPGVLVVGQPLFSDKAGFLGGTLLDWNLSDHRQYSQLARLLVQSRHSVVILTGDVHYGRIAWCTLTSGGELVEVISSPMSLVDQLAEGSWEAAPDLFPPFAISGVVRAPVQTLGRETFSPIRGHFLTLEFASVGARIQMSVRLWPAFRQGAGAGPGFGDVVYQRSLF
jgi:hypothetical protein